MSYEIAGFDPLNPKEDALPIIHINQDNIGLHIVDPEVIAKKSLEETVVLIDTTLPVSGHGVRMGGELRPGKNYEGHDARLFEGLVDVLPGHFNRTILDERLERGMLHDAYHWQDKAYSDVHFYRSAPGWSPFDSGRPVSDYLDFAVELEPRNNRMRLRNQAQFEFKRSRQRSEYDYFDNRNASGDAGTLLDEDDDDNDNEVSSGRPLHRRILMAPAADIFSEDKDSDKQIIFYLRGLVHFGTIAHELGQRKPTSMMMDDLIITPDGPLYFNRDRGGFVHSLERAVTVLREKPTKAEKQAYKKPKSFEKPDPAMTFDDMYGIDHLKKPLMQIANFYRHPEKVARWRATHPKGVLLYGPAGTGKTSLAHALANSIGADIREVKADQIYNMYFGESERRIGEIFKEAREAQEPVVFLFDEIEGLVSTTESTGGAAGAVNAIAGIFKKEVSAIPKMNPNVTFVAATNYIDRVDPTLIRAGRFDLQLQVGEPNEAARRAIFSGIITEKAADDFSVLPGVRTHIEEQLNVSMEPLGVPSEHFQVFDGGVISSQVLGQLAAMTEGRTGADIRSIIDEVLSDKLDADIAGLPVGPVTTEDLVRKIRERSVR